MTPSPPALEEIKPATSFQRAASHLQAHFARDSATKRGSWRGRRARSSFQSPIWSLLLEDEGVNLVFLTAKGRRFIQSALELQPRVSQFKIQIPLDAPFCSARWRGERGGDDVWSLVIGEGGTVENHDFSSRHRPDGLTVRLPAARCSLFSQSHLSRERR